MRTFIIAATLIFSASTLANPFKSEVVEVSILANDETRTFKLVCQPTVPVGELPKDWVNTCNDIGKKILELAVDKGVKVPNIDKAFGMAGEFSQNATAALPENFIPEKIISREFGG
ncbi:hypothetical protein AB4298_11790 [Shewanella sp. 10N.261.52.F9]|uniref:hypothetical protein n=1 Tax=Shewanella TaxID=22 RepID=UPI00200CF929|nr:hypothetical protein [Shewanella marinintestina]MCL1147989.1 hypothetical protein [Shewanella marinintestina]